MRYVPMFYEGESVTKEEWDRRYADALEASDLPPVVDVLPTPVRLTPEFKILARAWRLPTDMLASYVCEEYGRTHHPDQPLIIIHRPATP